MTQPACEAAARAWLERLPAAERVAAHARTDVRLLVWLGAGALLVATCLWLARADVGGRLRRALEASRPRPGLAGALAATAIFATLATVKGLYDVLIAWPAEGVGGSLSERATAAVASIWSATAIAVLLAAALQWLLRARPRTGPLMAGLTALALSLAVGWGPYAFGRDPGLTAAPAGPVRDGLARLAMQAKISTDGVWLSPNPSFDADVTGGFGRARVVVGEQMLDWPVAEARAYVGHLMGHYVHADVLVVFLLYGLTGLATLIALQLWAAPIARSLGAREASSAERPDAAPAAALIVVFALGAAMLVTTGYLRWANVRADAFSLDHAHEADGLAAVLERTWDHESVDPNPFEAAIFYSHPPLGERIAHAMCWKATPRK